jgi:hypothetical protein
LPLVPQVGILCGLSNKDFACVSLTALRSIGLNAESHSVSDGLVSTPKIKSADAGAQKKEQDHETI